MAAAGASGRGGSRRTKKSWLPRIYGNDGKESMKGIRWVRRADAAAPGGSAGPVTVNMRAFGAIDTTSGFSGAVGWETTFGRCRELRLPGGEHADGPGRCPDLAQGFLFAVDRAERIHPAAIFEPRGHVSR